jgi:multiple sugar transport system permease protein
MVIRRIVIPTFVYIFLTLIGLYFLIPLLWPVFASINTSATLALQWPAIPSFDNYIT